LHWIKEIYVYSFAFAIFGAFVFSFLLIFEKSLLGAKRILLLHAGYQILCAVLAGISIYFCFQKYFILVPGIWLGLVLLVSFLCDVYTEIKFRNLEVSFSYLLKQSLRFSLVGLTGVLLCFGFDKIIQTSLMKLAMSLSLSEFQCQLVVWLRAPISIVFSQLAINLCAPYLYRWQVPSHEVHDKPWITQFLTLVKSPKEAKKLKFFETELDSIGFYPIRMIGKNVFVSSKLLELIPESTKSFLLVREYAERALRLRRQRMFYSFFVMVFLLVPYLLTVQLSTYYLPTVLLIPAWIATYLTLALTQFILGRRYQSWQSLRQNQWALSGVEANFSLPMTAYEELLSHNAILKRTPLPLGVPRQSLSRLSFLCLEKFQKLSPKQDLLTLSGVLVLTLLFYAHYLMPRYEIRKAASEGNWKVLQEEISQGRSPNSIDVIASGQTPLMAAARGNDEKIVEYLLKQGANPNLTSPLGFSPLLLAAEKGNFEIVKSLVYAQADVNYHGFKGYTPLMLAARHGHLGVTQYLLENGADINAKSRHQSTPLMLALQAGQLKAVVVLLQHHPDLDVKDKDGDDALTIARRKNLLPVVKWIESKKGTHHEK
jgi:hypothetical protein